MNTTQMTAPLVRVQPKGQVTLSPALRKQVGIAVGDYVEIKQERGRIVLVPQDVAPRHPKIDKAIAAGLADIRAGRVTPTFKNMKEYAKWRKTPAGREFARS